MTSFESVRYVYVAYHDFEEKWSLYVEATDTKVRFTQVDAWSGVIWAYAEGNSADELGFRYRKTGDEAWTEVDKEQINISGGAFDTCITGLTPETQYEVVAYSGSNETEVASVTTEAAPQLPNGGFEEWETIDKVVYPYLADGIHFWNSGNKGASIGNATPTDKTTDVRPGTSGIYAAQAFVEGSQVWSAFTNWPPAISLQAYSTESEISRTVSSASDNLSKPVRRLCTAGSNTTREC